MAKAMLPSLPSLPPNPDRQRRRPRRSSAPPFLPPSSPLNPASPALPPNLVTQKILFGSSSTLASQHGPSLALHVGSEMTTVNLEDVLYRQSDDGVDYGNVASLTDDNILRKKFGRFHGFGICEGNMFKDGGGNLIREGLRHRNHYNRVDRRRSHKPETRTNCEPRICIYLDRSNNIWRVKKVITEHNHALTHPGMVHLILNFRSMTEAAKAQIDGMQGYGISTSKMM
ncbi:hypothetical protein Ahy_A07g036721 [Arachis hypogaea]|uniref:FAR1 domain-containing protein n=1 Tax=Arachis hypogaea TaxID=3818 RepID=A0A445CGU4_ARAHY|nr:hypothetical protein Ahy_A07g036721 [Arachis hypogaea]